MRTNQSARITGDFKMDVVDMLIVKVIKIFKLDKAP